MRKNDKKLKLFSLIFLILFVVYFQTIVYSALSSTMKITGDAYARVEADVRITDFRLATTNNATSSFEEFGKNHIVTEIDLIDNSSYITYYVEITNYGSVDVGIFDITGIPSGVNYSIKDYNLKDKICDDSGKCNSFIKKTYEITLTTTGTYAGNVQLNFEFKRFNSIIYTGITNNNYPSSIMEGENLNVTFINDIPNKINIYVNGNEIDRSAYFYNNTNGQLIYENIPGDLTVEKAESTLIDGRDFSAKLKNFANDTTDAVYNSTDSSVTYIGIFEDEIPPNYTKEQFLNLPSTEVSSNGRIKAYKDNGKIYIYSIDDILAPVDSYSLFRGYSNLTELNISELDTRKLEGMGAMFQDLTSLEYLDISSFDVKRVWSMFYTFYNCVSLKEIKLPSFDKLKSISSVFGNCQSLESLDLSDWDVSKVTSMSSAFVNCYSLKTLNLSNWDTSNVTEMTAMFRYNQSLETLDISSFNTSKVTTMERMFGYCSKLKKIYVGDGWDTTNVTISESMFSNTPLLPNFDSTVVDVTKAYVGEGGYLTSKIQNVTIDGVTYQFEDGMTWGEWVDSEYNTSEIVIKNCIYLAENSSSSYYLASMNDDVYVTTTSLIDSSLQYYILKQSESGVVMPPPPPP